MPATVWGVRAFVIVLAVVGVHGLFVLEPVHIAVLNALGLFGKTHESAISISLENFEE